MARFRKGTTDHDGDGRMGGSKKASAKPAPKKAEKPAEPKAPSQADIEAADLVESIGRHPGGMEPPLSEDQRKAVLEAEFASADAVGDPRRDELAAIKQVRGF